MLLKPKLTPHRAMLAQAMYNEVGSDSNRLHTVQETADKFGVTRPTIYLDRHADQPSKQATSR